MRTPRVLLALGLVVVGALSSRPALATPCTLLALDKAEGAQVKVYFTRFEKEDTSGGRYKGCRLVKKAVAGTVTFFVTPFRQDATIVVHRSNWPE